MKTVYTIPTRKHRIPSAFHVKILLENTIWVTHWGDEQKIGAENASSQYKINLNKDYFLFTKIESKSDKVIKCFNT